MGDEDFAGFRAEVLNLVLLQLYCLARSVSSDCSSVANRMCIASPLRLLTFEKPVDNGVEINLSCCVGHVDDCRGGLAISTTRPRLPSVIPLLLRPPKSSDHRNVTSPVSPPRPLHSKATWD